MQINYILLDWHLHLQGYYVVYLLVIIITVLKIKNPEGSKYKWSDYYPTLEEKEKIAEHLNRNIKLIEKRKLITDKIIKK